MALAKPEPVSYGNLIADVLDKPNDDANLSNVAEQVKALCARFPSVRQVIVARIPATPQQKARCDAGFCCLPGGFCERCLSR